MNIGLRQVLTRKLGGYAGVRMFPDVEMEPFGGGPDCRLGVVVVDERAFVLSMSSTARGMLRGGGGLTLKEGHLVATTLRETILLRRSIGTMLKRAEACRVALRGARIRRPGGTLDIVISPLPLPGSTIARGAPAALIYMIEATTPAQADAASTPRYDLTPAELKVVTAILQGHSGQSAAEFLGVSYNTLKTHLKRIYAKTGTNNQAALIRLLLDPTDS